MAERRLAGLPAAPGLAAGRGWAPPSARRERGADPPHEPEAAAQAALAALAAAGAELQQIADELAESGRRTEAEIVGTGALMASDPAMTSAVRRAAEGGMAADEALLSAACDLAGTIASLPDPTLAARADDVRSLGRRAVAALRGEASTPPAGAILVAADIGPADVAQAAAAIRGIALAGSAPTAHAAIVARGLGIPMVVGAGAGALELAGATVAIDGDAGLVIGDPDPSLLAAANAAVSTRERQRERVRANALFPARTREGRDIAVHVNAATSVEADAGIAAGAEGIGLVRTELAFLDFDRWPTEGEHRAMLEQVVAAVPDRPVIVRVLDFGGDKLPPFLDGETARGIQLLLRHPEHLAAQLRAIAAVGAPGQVRCMVPLVRTPVELVHVRAMLREAAGDRPAPPLGAMVELPVAAGNAYALAERSDFLSIGTNDLASSVLGRDRFAGGPAPAHHPRVLALIERTVQAARAAKVPLEVCGEAASDPTGLALLVGLGVTQVSVGAARVGAVREWIRQLSMDEVQDLAERALIAADDVAVRALAEPLAERLRLLDEAGQAGGQGVDGNGRVVPLRAQA